MEGVLKPKILSYEDISKITDEFLNNYYPSRKVPVPIEDIVDLKFGIDIVPVKGLRRSCNVDGFISGNFKEITVDWDVQEKYENRYRSTLAHEIGHLILHRHIIGDKCPRNMTEFKNLVKSIELDNYRWFEYQAYAFSGLVLVPRGALDIEVNKWTKHVQSYTDFVDDLLDPIWERIADELAVTFSVSKDIINIRLRKDGHRG